jgi:hypothetical protein
MELLPQVIGELKDVFQEGGENGAETRKAFGAKTHAQIPVETTKPIYDSSAGIYSSKNDPIADYSRPYAEGAGAHKNQSKPESVVYTSAQTTAAPSSTFGGQAGSSVFQSKVTGEKPFNKLDDKFDAAFSNKGEKKWTNATTGDNGSNK